MSERPKQRDPLPHENLFNTSRHTLYRTRELLADPQTLSDEQLARLEAMAADMMTKAAEIGDIAKQERALRGKRNN